MVYILLFLGLLGIYMFLKLSSLEGEVKQKKADQVSGTVTYRQRIALKPESKITVSLQDISKQDIQAEIISQQVILTKGKQIPFSYALPYDPQEIDKRMTYSVSAKIEDGVGKMTFKSDTANLVITKGNPLSDVEIVVKPI